MLPAASRVRTLQVTQRWQDLFPVKKQQHVYHFFIYRGAVCISLRVNTGCLRCLLPNPRKMPEAFLLRHQNLLFLNSKTMFLHPSINIHQIVKLEACSFFVSVCVCVCVQMLLREGSHLCVREDPACVCACVQQAPIGMNYLEESLFYLSTVGWPWARKVLLPTTQETTLIHHRPFCSMPPSHPPTQVLPACSGVPQQMSPLIVALASWRTV